VRLLVATRNRGKLRELQQLVEAGDLRLELASLDDYPDAPEVAEDGETFVVNAVAKARGMMLATQQLTLADDSGLEVDALGGAPGVRSARYAGASASDGERIALLLRNLQDVPVARRTARFRCAVALADPADPLHVEVREGVCEGRILDRPRGSGGFGYDPVFLSVELDQTFAEAPALAKHAVSHRGRALRAIVDVLRRRVGDRGV
jgi:XTP/dITP diphosphohydrolase